MHQKPETSISAPGAITTGVGAADSHIHMTVRHDGTIEVVASRRGTLDEQIRIDMDDHQLRALRDAVEKTLRR